MRVRVRVERPRAAWLLVLVLGCAWLPLPAPAQLACGPVPGDHPAFGGDKLRVKEGVTVNGNPVADGDTGVNSAIDRTGGRANVALTLPPLDPPTFPANGSGVDADEGDSPFVSTTAVFYDEIKIDDGESASFSGGGPFHIDKLEVAKNATVSLAAGTYFIDELKLEDGAELIVTSEPVIIHVGDKVDIKKDVDVNVGGSVTGLRFFLHEDAEFKADEALDFTGMIYGPLSKKIEVKKESTFHGLAVTGGELKIEKDVTITYSDADAAAVGGLSTCAGPSSFRIVHDGFGIHCVDEVVTLEPRDASGATFLGYIGTIVLDTQSGAGTWVATTGNGTLTDPTADDGLATYAFSGTESLPVGFTLRYRTGASLINVDAYASATPSLRDDDAEGDLAFGPSGFTLTAVPLANPPGAIPAIPTQTAAVPFALYLTAYGQTPADPECGVIEGYAGTRPVKLWSAYGNPGSGTRAVTVDGIAIAAAEAGAVARDVDFVLGQSTAPLAVKYKDVGSLSLGAKDDSVADPNLPAGIRGASNPFVWRPAGFALSAIRRTADGFPNPGAAGPSGPVFIAAGEDFSVTVTALDAEGDATPNFGQEAPAEGVALTAALVAPAGGNVPAVQPGAGFGAFAGGTATGTTFRWDEVGVVTLTPSVADASYLGTGDVTGAASANVGRFVPFDFDVSLDTAPAFAPGCGSFTYQDQPFDYATAPRITITARSKAGTRTLNYDGPWWKLADLAETLGHDGALPPGVVLDTALAGHTPIDCSAGTCDGQVSVTFAGPLTYARGAAPAGPFDGLVDIAVPVVDTDGVAYATNPFRIEDIGFAGGAAAQRYGRLALGNVHGSELLALPMPARAEYFDGAGFVTSAEDGCSALAVSNLTLANDLEAGQTDGDIVLGAGSTTASLGNTPFAGGAAGLAFSPPGAGNTGYVDVTPDLSPATGAGLPWLQFDWDGNGSFDDPSARASFGIHAGSPFLIHLREPWN